MRSLLRQQFLLTEMDSQRIHDILQSNFVNKPTLRERAQQPFLILCESISILINMEGIKTYNHSQWFRDKRLARERLNPKFVKLIKVAMIIIILAEVAVHVESVALTNGIKAVCLSNTLKYHNCYGFEPVH